MSQLKAYLLAVSKDIGITRNTQSRCLLPADTSLQFAAEESP
jgi:hypothetical protein